LNRVPDAQRAPSRVDRDTQQRMRVVQAMLLDGRNAFMGATRCDFLARERRLTSSHRAVRGESVALIRSIPILDGSIEVRFNDVIQKNFSCGFASIIGRFRSIK
jgi:hypothetical protein